jgi:hypothetical protein
MVGGLAGSKRKSLYPKPPTSLHQLCETGASMDNHSLSIMSPQEDSKNGMMSALSKQTINEDSDSMRTSLISENNNATSSLLEGSVGV